MKFNEDLGKEALAIISPILQKFLEEKVRRENKEMAEVGLAVCVIAGNKKDKVGVPEVFTQYQDTFLNGEKYAGNALSKAEISWEHELPSQIVALRYPVLLDGDDFPYGGGIVRRLNDYCIAVGTSGLREYEDEYVSELLMTTMFMLIDKHIYEKRQAG